MNLNVYMEIIGDNKPGLSFIEASASSDAVGIVLRMHLICELLTEAWVCAACNQRDLFMDGDKPIRIECDTKLKLARNLGLPVPLYNAMKTINKVRNRFAHQSSSSITEADISSIQDNLLNMPDHNMLLNDDSYGLRSFNEDGSLKNEYIYKTAPAEIKLLILTSKIFYLITSLATIKSDTYVKSGEQ
ncbi:hypothetical protein KFL82_004782 [Salmonella enterica]|nr:hypothetical protein [Salmonella enterica]EHL6881142.1 hypothetical protein [Salmonella enterica]EHL6896114.1 hypothetical protein [Salmonella enterica]EHL6909924.1 hypothetical protein [Salmonella enterica]EIB2628834.1 hypothetical protein [Salmonella enterica]